MSLEVVQLNVALLKFDCELVIRSDSLTIYVPPNNVSPAAFRSNTVTFKSGSNTVIVSADGVPTKEPSDVSVNVNCSVEQFKHTLCDSCEIAIPYYFLHPLQDILPHFLHFFAIGFDDFFFPYMITRF